MFTNEFHLTVPKLYIWNKCIVLCPAVEQPWTIVSCFLYDNPSYTWRELAGLPAVLQMFLIYFSFQSYYYFGSIVPNLLLLSVSFLKCSAKNCIQYSVVWPQNRQQELFWILTLYFCWCILCPLLFPSNYSYAFDLSYSTLGFYSHSSWNFSCYCFGLSRLFGILILSVGFFLETF